MNIRTYLVVDASTHQSPAPQQFKDTLLAHAGSNTYLTLTARPVLDELSKRRGEQAEEREFHFRIYEIHFDGPECFASMQDIETTEWASLRVANDIQFTVVS